MRLAWLLAVGAVVGAWSAAAPSASAAPAKPQARSRTPGGAAIEPGITVRGSQLLRNGIPWEPRGVQIVGDVAPDGALSGKYVPAHAHFGQAELQAALAAHADVVRFQVSQFGLDPSGPLYSSTYVQEVWNAVQLARGLGLDVIVSLQAEPPAGEPTRCPLPDGGAERAWDEIAPMFAGDSGIMFELYNEPAIAATAVDWQLWRNGGTVTTASGSCEAVGMQTLIDDIRARGASNVIIVPGLAGEVTLGGMPAPTDPGDPSDPQLAYGIHYPSMTQGVNAWDRAFGRASGHAPVVVTEWDANSTTNCHPAAAVESTFLLDYLASKRIGLVGFAFDLPGTIVADYAYDPTSYASFTCGVANGGPGQLLFGDYAGAARAGAQGGSPPAWIVSAATLARLAALAPATVAHAFNSPRTFVTGMSSPQLAALSVPAAIPTMSYANETALAAVVGDQRLRPGTQAVAYAPGNSSRTPRAQQRNPGVYFKRAAQIAHAHGLLLIAEPAVNLVKAEEPGVRSAQLDNRFLKLRIAASAARYADVYESDAQASELHSAQFADFVRAASKQAAGAHPGVELLSEISTGLDNRPPSAAPLLDAVSRTGAVVSGYLLNVPQAANHRTAARSSSQALALLRDFNSSAGY